MNAVSPRNDKKPRSLRSGADKSVKNQPRSEVAGDFETAGKAGRVGREGRHDAMIVPTLAPAAFVQFPGVD
jgi:hypothetical protein